jgi:serine/threonine protein kinase
VDRKDLRTSKEIELIESEAHQETARHVGAGQSQTFEEKQTQDSSPDLTIVNHDVRSEDVSYSDRHLGKVIGGHYEILSLIGLGGMSTVYRARHQLLDRDVAVKFLALGRQFDSKALQRFQEEAKAAVGLQHTNICGTREFGITEDGVPFLVMDYIEGTSLGDVLREERTLSEQKVIEIILGVCAGLKHAHDNRVIHRDIKPANIMLTKNRNGDNEVKIVDFGIAKLMRDDDSGPNLTQTGEVFGTPKYMSPEQCHGSKVDARGDIYALGCILFEMLSGNAPFHNESAIQILFAHVNSEPPSLGTNVGKDLRAVVEECLQKDPTSRYQSMSDLMADLEAIKAGNKPLHANTKTGQYKILLGAILAIFSVLVVLTITLSSLTINRNNETKLTNQWEKLHSDALNLGREKKFAEEEIQLEHCLEIAQNSRNETLIGLTLQELSNVEDALGKTEESAGHKKAIVNKIKVGGLSKFFLSISFALIGLAGLTLLFFTLLFGRNRNTTLKALFTKRK